MHRLDEEIDLQTQAMRELARQIEQLPHILQMLFDVRLASSPDGASYINGFRFAPLLSQWIKENTSTWEEVNAAWGEAALLLYTISKRSGVQLHEYDGSHPPGPLFAR